MNSNTSTTIQLFNDICYIQLNLIFKSSPGKVISCNWWSFYNIPCSSVFWRDTRGSIDCDCFNFLPDADPKKTNYLTLMSLSLEKIALKVVFRVLAMWNQVRGNQTTIAMSFLLQIPLEFANPFRGQYLRRYAFTGVPSVKFVIRGNFQQKCLPTVVKGAPPGKEPLTWSISTVHLMVLLISLPCPRMSSRITCVTSDAGDITKLILPRGKPQCGRYCVVLSRSPWPTLAVKNPSATTH